MKLYEKSIHTFPVMLCFDTFGRVNDVVVNVDCVIFKNFDVVISPGLAVSFVLPNSATAEPILRTQDIDFEIC